MVTAHREGGFNIVIFTDDHEPAHVHVIKDGDAKFELGDGDVPPALVYSVGMKRGDVRKAMRIVVEQRDTLLARWRAIHG